ncbi:NADH-quinone oxidoreductase subunit K [Microbacterium album]|uniref:Uncharacterized protein n=1 Tax=Microbacterium album TaxID=2053191 RepID=A0A917IES5_9MICO|nr:NADH-quinone oxidoreductase subunit K [Microbacterium album]GGH45710.1 hypothetical protein GCM10010921_21290 [Microbacterium album]
MTVTLWYLLVGSAIAVAACARMLLSRDPVGRLIAMNVVGAGAFLIMLALAARSEQFDPVLAALVITGLVITVAFTGLGAVLIRRIEGAEAADGDDDGDDTGDDGRSGDRAGGE